ncbi:MAG: hypothetical protein ILO42_04355 [Clostridia bacterium]|nr:hypothetical protein [Clostridia bacterium]
MRAGGWGKTTLLCLPRLGKVSPERATDGAYRTASGTMFALTDCGHPKENLRPAPRGEGPRGKHEEAAARFPCAEGE